MIDTIVIGAGLIGSAAAKYLAASGMDVALIGPDEPATPASGEVFSSHYDQGRIVRALDRDEHWSDLAQKSMRRFVSIERESGIQFHTRCGFLNVGRPVGHPGETHSLVESMARTFGIDVVRLDTIALARRFPFFHFPEPYAGILEHGPAGWINPRALVRAQQESFNSHGGRLIRDVVMRVERRPNGFALEGRRDRYAAGKILVCAGAWSHLMGLTPASIDVTIKAETVILIPVASSELSELSSMPTLWYTFDWHPVLPHVYLVPPIRYPDGSFYIKIGADNDRDVALTSPGDARDYFRSEGSVDTRRNLLDVAAALLPGFIGREVLSKPCILTYSSNRRPIVQEMADDWFVATAGNGSGAKSSDEIGRLAAQMLLGR